MWPFQREPRELSFRQELLALCRSLQKISQVLKDQGEIIEQLQKENENFIVQIAYLKSQIN